MRQLKALPKKVLKRPKKGGVFGWRIADASIFGRIAENFSSFVQIATWAVKNTIAMVCLKAHCRYRNGFFCQGNDFLILKLYCAGSWCYSCQRRVPYMTQIGTVADGSILVLLRRCYLNWYNFIKNICWKSSRQNKVAGSWLADPFFKDSLLPGSWFPISGYTFIHVLRDFPQRNLWYKLIQHRDSGGAKWLPRTGERTTISLWVQWV